MPAAYPSVFSASARPFVPLAVPAGVPGVSLAKRPRVAPGYAGGGFGMPMPFRHPGGGSGGVASANGASKAPTAGSPTVRVMVCLRLRFIPDPHPHSTVVRSDWSIHVVTDRDRAHGPRVLLRRPYPEHFLSSVRLCVGFVVHGASCSVPFTNRHRLAVESTSILPLLPQMPPPPPPPSLLLRRFLQLHP